MNFYTEEKTIVESEMKKRFKIDEKKTARDLQIVKNSDNLTNMYTKTTNAL